MFSVGIYSVFVSDCVLKLWHKNNWNNHWAPVIDRCRLCDEQARVKFDYVSKCNSNSLVNIPIGRVEKYPTMH